MIAKFYENQNLNLEYCVYIMCYMCVCVSVCLFASVYKRAGMQHRE